MKNEDEIKQLSVPVLLFLHLFPGLVILLLSIWFANPHGGLGLPVFLSLLLAVGLGLIPVELGVLYYVARKEGRKISGILGYTTPMPVGRTLLWALPCLVIAVIAFVGIKEAEHTLLAGIFSWVPDWFRINVSDIGSISLSVIWITVILNFILSGILGPLVEELYFRGYLLPRMKRFGNWAPFVNTLLFSVYHFFTPWENITRIIAITPMAYTVWYKRNIRIGVIVHCALNTLSAILLAAYLLC